VKTPSWGYSNLSCSTFEALSKYSRNIYHTIHGKDFNRSKTQTGGQQNRKNKTNKQQLKATHACNNKNNTQINVKQAKHNRASRD